MNVLVCVKPDITGREIGPLEAVAVEAALELKDRAGACRVDLITAGPPHWAEVLQRGLRMGADTAYHVLTRPTPPGPDGLVPAAATARRLSRALARGGLTPEYDLILTGLMSQDLMAGEVGPMLAMALGLPLATAVVRLREEGGRVLCEREWEGGIREALEIPLPAVVTLQAGHYTPRYPSLSNILKAASVENVTLAADDPGRGVVEPEAVFLAAIEPEKTRAGRLVRGSIEDQVRIFTSFLQERALL